MKRQNTLATTHSSKPASSSTPTVARKKRPQPVQLVFPGFAAFILPDAASAKGAAR